MRRLNSHADIILENFCLPDRVVIDVGCGTGDLVRWMAGQGASVTGIDTTEMLAKAEGVSPRGTEKYLVGGAEELPFEDRHADLITYIASLHHAPEDKMFKAIEECGRVLRPGGHAVFVEPIARPGSYYEVVRLINDETEIQAKAYAALQAAGQAGLRLKSEEICYVERSFADYTRLLSIFVDDDQQRSEILAQARGVTERLSREAGQGFEDFRYQSICRVMLFERQ